MILPASSIQHPVSIIWCPVSRIHNTSAIFLLPDTNIFVYILPGTSLEKPVFLLCQGISPWLPTPLRIVSTGIGVSVFLLLFALLLSDKRWEKVNIAISIAFATLLSITLRAFGSTIDISLNNRTVIIGWLLIILTCWLLWRLFSQTTPEEKNINVKPDVSGRSLYFFVAGIFSVITLIYFTLASPGVLSRWTGTSYLVIHIILPFSIVLIIFLLYYRIPPGIVKKWHLVIWNILFSFL